MQTGVRFIQVIRPYSLNLSDVEHDLWLDSSWTQSIHHKTLYFILSTVFSMERDIKKKASEVRKHCTSTDCLLMPQLQPLTFCQSVSLWSVGSNWRILLEVRRPYMVIGKTPTFSVSPPSSATNSNLNFRITTRKEGSWTKSILGEGKNKSNNPHCWAISCTGNPRFFLHFPLDLPSSPPTLLPSP